MARIKNETEYKAIMKRVDELFFTTDETTTDDNPRLVELDMLSRLVEEYEKGHHDTCHIPHHSPIDFLIL